MLNCEFKIKTGTKTCDHYLASDKQGEPGFCSLPSRFRCPEAILAKGMRLSHSSVQNFLRCKRLWKYKEVDGITVRSDQMSAAANMGMLWDKCNDILYGNTDLSVVKDTVSRLRIDEYDESRVRALFKAHKSLELKIDTKDLIGLQAEFFYHHFDTASDDVIIHGFYDRLYGDHFVECKLTSSPEYYLSPFLINSQIGTYFLANDNLGFVDMEVVRRPAQKPYKESSKRVRRESASEFYERIYADIMARPSYYFVGLNRKTWKYGKRFYRDEFDLNELADRYKFILAEIRDCVKRESFYCNDKACMMFGSMCEYLDICRTGAVSETVFEYKEKLMEKQFESEEGKS